MGGNWYAHDIYLFMLNIASKYGLAVKEVESAFLRKQAQELGFECFHQKVKIAKPTGLPYCSSCWARLEQTKPPVYDIGSTMKRPHIKEPAKYRPLRTFLDEIEEERSRRVALTNPDSPSYPSDSTDPTDPATTTQ